ncbi:O-antigen ligase [uncultured Psychroserpens sp.]|uniref:O-antigen ligase family protein n=1 Tax=uncultured Psychroserpens sp. TaxID=255436 RepID=UPI002636E736|nr:O-antigen ligase family protein [uncultured Psychroserpens sp.]
MKYNLTYPVSILLHVLIGVAIYFNEFLAKIYFWAALSYLFVTVIISPENKKIEKVLQACAYFVGAEVLLRMTRGAISYEASKYLVIVFVSIGMFYKGLSGKGYPYFLYMMFLVPSIFVASTTLSFDANFRTNIAFVLSGPICLGMAALFCYDKKVTINQLSEVLLYVFLPIISLTTYLFLYTPSVGDVLSNTASNRATSGGFGPNQVATVLGLGMFIATVRFFNKSPNLGLKILNVSLLILISFRAVVTFSRGGVLAALIMMIAFLVVYYSTVSKKRKREISFLVLIFGFSMVATWFISTNQTDGLIELRYANKDHLGREKKDVTTGRGELFINELEGFISNPFLGIGSSRAKDSRYEIDGQGVTSHSEVSRTLAEHGIFGVAILLILLVKPLDFRARNKRNYYFYAFLCFWFATINHSSMRISAPAFIYALALLQVVKSKPYLRKRRIENKP